MADSALIALIIFIITYLGIIFTRLPGVNVDRPSAAYCGAIAMVLLGVLTPAEAVAAIDTNTIFLLLGMMIVIATLQLDGFFDLIAKKTISYSKTRFRLLCLIVFVTGISSAFLVNDAVVLMFTPVIIQICRSSKLNPVPYLIGEILASNIGSVMTITGNPQNMLIGLASGNFLRHIPATAAAGFADWTACLRLVSSGCFTARNSAIRRRPHRLHALPKSRPHRHPHHPAPLLRLVLFAAGAGVVGVIQRVLLFFLKKQLYIYFCLFLPLQMLG